MDAESLYTTANMFKQASLDFISVVGRGTIALSIALAVFLSTPGVSAKQDLASASAGQQTIGEQVIGKKSYVVSTMIVNARPENCFRICTDYKHAATVFPTLKKCQVVQDNGATKLVNYVTHPTGSFTDYDYVLEVKETPYQMIEWKRVYGDFKAIDGYWKLDSTQGGSKTQVTYATYVDGGLFMPQILIKRQFRIDLPPAMIALKNEAESVTNTNARVAGKPGSNAH